MLGCVLSHHLVLKQLKHLFTAIAERYDTVISFAPNALPPIKNGKPWKHVYMVNDFGVAPSSLAPVHFCKSEYY
jgi:hypothetical protein